MTQPAFMRRPWRITPCPSVHAGALLYMDIILTASKLLRKAQYIVWFAGAFLGCEIN